ncbi:hypothetical protein BCR37DRAFT_410859 [Protomyces lactucae-debilis]|uniref:Serine/threonine-protein kinase Tel1 n=1 Tax=Protomyces lactucae-debilis TaxID=2754530 RepID=A0A1Y2F0I8_PROLT|nr:uncharacterized protein BCR37DRAFT_410859 [Protomyces lactucae-debilis]ORY77398.1 hypothetical protein BCR37DRAFT_410859 [Protomyces lactucae-debilis]
MDVGTSISQQASRLEFAAPKERGMIVASIRQQLTHTDSARLTEKVVNQLLNVLYKQTVEDKALLAKTSSKSGIELRLSQTSQLIRDVLNGSKAVYKYKVVRTFLSSMLHVLPARKDILLKPISANYLRACVDVLSYRPHLDHLELDLWLECVNFFLTTIENYERGNDSEHGSTVQLEVVQLSDCLALLLTWHATDYAKMASETETLVVRTSRLVSNFLRDHSRENNAHVPMVAILCTLLRFTLTNSREIAQDLTTVAMEVLIQTWSTRSPDLAVQLLTLAELVMPMAVQLAQADDAIAQNVQGLAVHLVATLMQSHVHLSINDLQFGLTDGSHLSWSPASDLGLATRHYRCLRLLCLSADVVYALEEYSRQMALSVQSSGKRVKLDNDVPKVMPSLLQGKSKDEILLALQIVCVQSSQQLLDPSKDALWERIIVLISSDDRDIQGWACVCTALRLSASPLHDQKDKLPFVNPAVLMQSVLRFIMLSSASGGLCVLATQLTRCLVMGSSTMSCLLKDVFELAQLRSLNQSSFQFLQAYASTLETLGVKSTEDTISSLEEWFAARLLSESSQAAMSESLDEMIHFLLYLDERRHSTQLSPNLVLACETSLLTAVSRLEDGIKSQLVQENPDMLFNIFRIMLATISMRLPLQVELDALLTLVHSGLKLVIPNHLFRFTRIFATACVQISKRDKKVGLAIDDTTQARAVRLKLLKISMQHCMSFVQSHASSFTEASLKHKPFEETDLVDGVDPKNAANVLLLACLALDRDRSSDQKSFEQCASHALLQSPAQLFIVGDNLGNLVKSLPIAKQADYASELVSHLARKYLADYAFERNAALHNHLIVLLKLSVGPWLSAEGVYPKLASNVFGWLVSVCLTSRLSAAETRVAMVHLLETLLNVDGMHVTQDNEGDMQSTRTTLLLRLKDGDARVGLTTASACVVLFRTVDEDDYETLYNDIHEACVPPDNTTESLSVRLHTLANIFKEVDALQSVTLTHLIELHQFPALRNMLQDMMSELADYSSSSPRELFIQHRKHVVFTWLGQGERIMAFPWTLFGFENISDWVQSCEDELVPVLISQGYLDQFSEMCLSLRIREAKLLHKHLRRTLVYGAIIHDGDWSTIERQVCPLLGLKAISEDFFDGRMFAMLFQALRDVPKSLTKMTTAIDKYVQDAESRRAWLRTAEVWLHHLSTHQLKRMPKSASYLTLQFQDLLSISTKKEGLKIQRLNKADTLLMVSSCLADVASTRLTIQHAGMTRLQFFLVLTDRKHLQGYIGQFILDALRHISIPQELKLGACSVFELVISTQGFRQSLSSRAICQACVQILTHCLEPLSNRDIVIDFVSSLKWSGFSTFSIVCKPTSSDAAQPDVAFESLLDDMMDCFADSEPANTRTTRQQFVHLVAQRASWFHEMTTATLRVKFLQFIGTDYQSTSHADAIFVGRLRAQAWCSAVGSWSCSIVPEEMQPGQRILSSILKTLSCSDIHTVFVTHRVLAAIQTDEILASSFPAYANLFYENDAHQEKTLTLGKVPAWTELHCEASFDTWSLLLVQRLEGSLMKSSLLRAIRPLLLFSTTFRRATLPAVLLIVLEMSDKLTNAELSETFRQTCQNYTKQSEAIFQCWFKAFEMLRYAAASKREQVKISFSFDLLAAAEAAMHYRLFDQALLCLHQHWSTFPESEKVRRSSVELSLYQAIEEPDSYYSLQGEGTLSAANKLARHERNGQKMLALGSALRSAELDRSSSTISSFLKQPFKAMHMFDAAVLSANEMASAPDEDDYEAAWRLELWDLPSQPTRPSHEPGIHEIIYRLQKHYRNAHVGLKSIDQQLVAEGYNRALMICKNPDQDVAMAMIFELDELLQNKADVEPCLEMWTRRSTELTQANRFVDLDSMLWSRQVMLSSSASREDGLAREALRIAQLRLLVHDYHNLPTEHLLQTQTTAVARAENIAAVARHIIPANLSRDIRAMTSTVLWNHGETNMSLNMLEAIVASDNQSHHQSQALNTIDLGLRMASARIKAPQEILERTLMPAIYSLSDESTDSVGQTFYLYASFCFEQLNSVALSEDSERLHVLCETQKAELSVMSSALERASHPARGVLQLKLKNSKVLLEQDEEELARLEKAKEVYLLQSLQHYLLAFGATDRHDDAISRCCSLWFANSHSQTANTIWSAHWEKVPSYKYLRIIQQLLSRLTQEDSPFQVNLQHLLLSLAKSHPFHVLYPMYAISSSGKKDAATSSRRAAATRLLQNLRSQSKTLKTLVSDINSCCAMYVKLARADSRSLPARSEWKDVQYGRDFLAAIAKVRLPSLTVTIEPRSSCHYTDLPVITGFGPHVGVANGNSRPKVLVCVLDDGSKLKELLKSGDDLRQDAVMQQVFLGVHAILQRNEDTRRRKLLIRTYHVLPLGDKVGVIQFVPGTMSFNDILPDLHKRHRPDDWDAKTCREKMRDVVDRSKAQRIEAYGAIMEHVKPVMRHVFVEWHAAAERWFATQLAYTRSTAAMSILGWILGLGDRHLSNIMIDRNSGDIVHIDLGICFEAGKLLKIPELVPFRLTRDVIDGMGIQGVEGIYKRCCTFTMDVLRKEQDSIKSILDILRYDPLYDWSVSPDKQKKQNNDDSVVDDTDVVDTRAKDKPGGETASWALLVVQQKLSKTLSATAMTNDLIQQATDPKRLAVIFCGWQPYY